MFTRNLRVLPSEVSCNGGIKLRSLLDCFQDTASLAVENIEGTSSELLRRGYAWVVMRYEIDFHGEMPRLDDDIEIRTYHDPFHGYNTLRMFHVHSSGNEIITAKTSWLLYDVRSGHAVKPVAHIPEIASGDTDVIGPEFEDIPVPGEIVSATEHHVTVHDTDMNGHMNNAVYFALVYDTVPAEIVTGKLRRIRASFRSGAGLGENISINWSGNGVCSVMRGNISRPCAVFFMEWEGK